MGLDPSGRNLGPAAGEELLRAAAGRLRPAADPQDPLAGFRLDGSGPILREGIDRQPLAHALTVDRDGLGRELDEALIRGGLTLEFQPKRRVAGGGGKAGTIQALEALVRWRHPFRGLVAPADLLRLAEETGLTARLSSWILREAIEHVSMWRESDPADAELGVCVNLSPHELGRPGLVLEVLTVLASSGVPPEALTLEVTQDALADRKAATATLGELRAAGVRIALDDFGGDPAALGGPSALPVDLVKIDPRLIALIGSRPAAADQVRSIIQRSRGLRLGTVAEGVETREQLVMLRQAGCELAQGYLFGKPLGASGIAAVLRAERRQRSGRTSI